MRRRICIQLFFIFSLALCGCQNMGREKFNPQEPILIAVPGSVYLGPVGPTHSFSPAINNGKGFRREG